MRIVSQSGGCNQSKSEESDLVRRAQRGDEEAFRVLFERYQNSVYGLLYHALGDREEAADLAQETFVRAFRSLPRLKAPAAFRFWLRRIAANICRDHFKRARLPVSSLEETPPGEDMRAQEVADPTGEDASAPLLKRELSQVVGEAILALSPEHRAVVRLHHLEGMEVQEIARMMRCSVGTVKSRLGRARERLRLKLRGYVEER